MHLHARVLRIPQGAVREADCSEVCAQFAVETVEQVEIEGFRHAGFVIVGGVQKHFFFDEVYSNENRVSRIERRANVRKEGVSFCRLKVADAGADIQNETPLAAYRRIERE